MYCNKFVLLVAVLGLMGLAVIFMFDPTHNYPTIEIEVEMLPGEETIIRVPTSTTGFLKWAGTLLRNPLLWLETNVDGLSVSDYLADMVPGTMLGIEPPSPPDGGTGEEGELVIVNTNNYTVTATLTATMAPSPSALGDSKAWWYIAYGVLQVVIASIIAMIKPTAQVFVRPPAKNTVGAAHGMIYRSGRCTKLRNLSARLCGMAFLRSTGTAGTGIELV